ncbi:MAG: MFS transporter [Xanthobacteraceae bacterium]
MPSMISDPKAEVDSAYSWVRLGISMLISTIGGVGMWSFVVALPTVQADFGVARGDISLAYTLLMLGFAGGSALAGRFADRFGIATALSFGAIMIGIGYVAAAYAPTLMLFALSQILIGFGTSTGFGPLIADVTHWFERRRGIAVGLCSSGNYFAGTIWPPIVQHFIANDGWRPTHIGIGIVCVLALLPLSLLLHRRRAVFAHGDATSQHSSDGTFGISPLALQVLLSIAGVACCVAMSMPQVHIVAYCSDLGYGVARGADMLALMMAFGIFSRIGSGFIADWVGGLRTLLLGSVLQGVALLLYAFFDWLTSLYVISALFGLFQGGIVPSYAIIVREFFSAREAGARLGIIIMMTVVGMALGGWMSGLIFDLTGSYRVAFINGLAWNLLNMTIVIWLLARPGRRVAAA